MRELSWTMLVRVRRGGVKKANKGFAQQPYPPLRKPRQIYVSLYWITVVVKVVVD